VEGRHQEPLVKVAVVTGDQNVEAVVWRRYQKVMTEQDIDDVAFLTGTNHSAQITHSICQSSPLIHNPCDTGGVVGNENNAGTAKKSLYENHGVASCSHNRALCIATIVFALLFTISIIIAFTGPQSELPEKNINNLPIILWRILKEVQEESLPFSLSSGTPIVDRDRELLAESRNSRCCTTNCSYHSTAVCIQPSAPGNHDRVFTQRSSVCIYAFPKLMRPYPIPFSLRPDVEATIQNMLDLGVIKREDQYASPLAVVKKKDGFNRNTGKKRCDIIISTHHSHQSAPQSNPTERVMKELSRLFRTYCRESHRGWVSQLKQIETLFNSTPHLSTGYSPNEILYGNNPPNPLTNIILPFLPHTTTKTVETIRNEVRQRLIARAQKCSSKFPLDQLLIDDFVLLRESPSSDAANKISSKFCPLFSGPFKITDNPYPNVYTLYDPQTNVKKDCTCIGEKPPNYVGEGTNMTRTFVPRATNGQIFPWNNIRLPISLRPIRYNLTIHPNLTTLEVRSQVSIEIHAEKDTNFIVIHCKNLTIIDKIIQDRRGYNLTINRILEYPGAQQLYIEIKEKFKKRHNYTLKIRYNSKLSKEPRGFYISSYTNKDGDKRYLATTHFKPTYARTAFPCFDEPQFKAKFRLTIFRDRFHITLFNTPVVNTDDLGFYMGTGLLRDDFLETRAMSTYLVAFIICDYTHQAKQTERGVSVSVYTSTPYISHAPFALNTTIHILNFFRELFWNVLPLSKTGYRTLNLFINLVAIPDFADGSMENWGLITYRETAILYDTNETSITAQQWVTAAIAHGITHQWFGNLVSIKWWNDLWLNEGMTIYLEYLSIDDYFPNWKMMEQFILDKTQPALALDALTSSHPITSIVADPSQIEAIFDTISYSKGAAIIRMMANFLQEDTLQNGLNEYLDTYKYTNVETKDLWNTLSRNTNNTLDVKVILDTWTNQMGFPLITLSREGNEVVATQERYLVTVENANISIRTQPKSKYDYKWYIPLTYFTSNDTETVRQVWMNMTDGEYNLSFSCDFYKCVFVVRFELDPEIRWIKANVNQSGFYRVMYDDDMWRHLINILKNNHTMFNPADRANLISDAFSLCRSGILNASIPLELSLYLAKERDYVPWATAIGHLKSWARRLSESLSYKLFLKYMRQLLKPVSGYVGWKKSRRHLEKLLCAEVLSAALLCDLNDTISHAKIEFQKWMVHNKTVDPNLKEVVYSAGIKYGGINEWQHCWNVYNNSTSPSERRLLLKALGTASDPWLLQRYLMETLDKNMVKPEDVKVVLEVVSANPEGRLLAWRHLKAYWPTMHSLYGNGTLLMGSLISAVTAYLSTPYDFYEVSTYFNGMNVGSATRSLEQSLEIIKLNINWVSQNEKDIYTWLKSNVK
ncbi:hypothetical protein NQ317_006251, partial [Molorchus minor]